MSITEIDEEFKGFKVEDYNKCLSFKRQFQSSILDFFSNSEVKALDIDIGPAVRSAQSPGVDTGGESFEQLYANRLDNPLLKIPLTEYNWKREIVCRTAADASNKRAYDVYYYNPEGKKFRSSNQIVEYLDTLYTELRGTHFSFSKGIVGVPELEWVRNAKGKVEKSDITQSLDTAQPNVFPAVKPTKKHRKRRLSKASLYDDEYGGQRKKLKTSLKEKEVSDEMEEWSLTIPGTTRETMGNPLTCSILCPLALGCIPTLQCTSCLCLYHHQCLNLDPETTYPKYVCINCKEKIQEEEREIKSKKEQKPKTTMVTKSNEEGKTKTVMITNQPSSEKKTVMILKNNASTDKRVPVITGFNNSTKKTIIHFSPQIISKTPIKKSQSKKTPANVMHILNRSTPMKKPLRPLAPAPNEINIPFQPVGNMNLPVQSIIQFGTKKFIAVPKKTANSFVTSLPSPVSESTKSNENQKPSSLKPPNAQAVAKTHHYVLTDGQLQAVPQALANDHQLKHNLKSPHLINETSNENLLALGSSGFLILVELFRYLPLCDLLRAAQVNQMFYAAARHSSLWKSVHLKNIHVKDWKKFAHCLKKNDTRHVNLTSMKISSEPEEVRSMWRCISEVIGRISTLQRVDMGRCAGYEITLISNSFQLFTGLTHLSCSFNKKSILDFFAFSHLSNLTHLFIRGAQLSKTIALKVFNIQCLSKLEKLTHLALTSVKQSSHDTNWVMFLSDMPQLEWLELGECTNLKKEFVTDALAKLFHLKHLRLEMVTELIANDVISTISTLPLLNSLELINFDVKSGFEEAFRKCENLRHVLIIPTYIKQSAVTVQRMVIALSSLNHVLKTVVWGLTLELLKVTEMLVTQHQFPLEEGVDCTNCVPIMPESCLDLENSLENKKSAQVEVITVNDLKDRLANEMLSVDVKVIKIPYVNTSSKFLPRKKF